MILDLVLCAWLAAATVPAVTLDIPCETLPQPVLVIMESRSCDGKHLYDYIAFRACPPSSFTWPLTGGYPCVVTSLIYAGPGLPLSSTTTESFGCP